MSRNILMITWPEESKAYQALSDLKTSTSTRILQAAVVQRTKDGRVQLRDGGSNVNGMSALAGGTLGAVIGILGGPLGMLLGFSTGALFGSLSDLSDAVDDTSVIAQLSSKLVPGSTALFVDIDENDHSTADHLTSASGGTLIRRSYEEVYDEVTSAEAAAHAAAKEASKVLHEQKKAERRAEREHKWEETKAKFKSFFHMD